MAKKKSSVKAMVKKIKAEAKAKREKSGTGNAALDRANAVAKKGAPKKGAVKAAAKKAESTGKPKPQFFGRQKAKKEVDPAKVKAERNAQHERMMRVDWYRDYRANSIALWVERRKAEAAGDKDAIEKINRKLERVNRERDKAKADWKAAGSVIPDEAPAVKEPKKKAEKKAPAAKKKAAKKPAAKKSRKAIIETTGTTEQAGDTTTTSTVDAGGTETTEIVNDDANQQ